MTLSLTVTAKSDVVRSRALPFWVGICVGRRVQRSPSSTSAIIEDCASEDTLNEAFRAHIRVRYRSDVTSLMGEANLLLASCVIELFSTPMKFLSAEQNVIHFSQNDTFLLVCIRVSVVSDKMCDKMWLKKTMGTKYRV